MHGRGIKTRYLGLILILRSEKEKHFIKHDRMQQSFKEHFQLIVFQKLWDWRLEKSCMKNHAYLLDHHPKISLRHDHDWTRGNDELGSTVEQQPVGKLVQQSRGEVQNTTFSQLIQPIPKPICDRSGQPEDTQGVVLATFRSEPLPEKRSILAPIFRWAFLFFFFFARRCPG